MDEDDNRNMWEPMTEPRQARRRHQSDLYLEGDLLKICHVYEGDLCRSF